MMYFCFKGRPASILLPFNPILEMTVANMSPLAVLSDYLVREKLIETQISRMYILNERSKSHFLEFDSSFKAKIFF